MNNILNNSFKILFKYLLALLFTLPFCTNAQQDNSSNQQSINSVQAPFRMQIQKSADTTFFGEMVIIHGPYSDGLDGFDAFYFGSPNYPGIYSIINPNSNSGYLGNATAPFVNDKVFRIGIQTNTNAAGAYKVKAVNTTAYTGTAMVFWIDSLTTPPTITNLLTTPTVNYNFAANDYFTNRFYINLSPTSYAVVNDCDAISKITITNPSSNPITYLVKNQATNATLSSGNSLVGTTIINNVANGNYVITLTNMLGASTTEIVTVNNSVFSGSINNADTILDYSSATINLSANVNGANANTIYLWNFGDNSPVSSAQNVSHTFNNIGTYTVKFKATRSNDCVFEDSIIVQVSDFTKIHRATSSLNSLFVSDKIIYADFGNDVSQNLSIEVYNIIGENVRTITPSVKTGKQQISIEDLPDGVYVIRQIQNSHSKSLKVSLHTSKF